LDQPAETVSVEYRVPAESEILFFVRHTTLPTELAGASQHKGAMAPQRIDDTEDASSRFSFEDFSGGPAARDRSLSTVAGVSLRTDTAACAGLLTRERSWT
jgi:hypothetical protein